jgi:hypothetical protein
MLQRERPRNGILEVNMVLDLQEDGFKQVRLQNNRAEKPTVRVSRSGLQLNCFFKDLFPQEYCQLWWNEDEKTIAIRPADKRQENAIPVRKQKSGYQIISSCPFIREARISDFLKLDDHTKSKKFSAEWSPKYRCIFVDLKKGGL